MSATATDCVFVFFPAAEQVGLALRFLLSVHVVHGSHASTQGFDVLPLVEFQEESLQVAPCLNGVVVPPEDDAEDAVLRIRA